MATQGLTQTQWVLDPTHSAIEFAAKHMVISTVRGRFAKYQVEISADEEAPERSTVEARIDAASIDTRDAQRDGHLRSADFLDAENHPWIVFKSRRIEPRGQDRFSLIGDLTIKGVTREVVVDGVYAGSVKDPWGNQRAGFSAEASINRKDFGLAWNVLLETGGLLVGDLIKISIDAELVKKQS